LKNVWRALGKRLKDIPVAIPSRGRVVPKKHPVDIALHSFGEWLKQQRRRLDLTQDQLATRCFCSASTIRKIESNDLVPSRSLVDQLAQVLQIPPALQPAFENFARGQPSSFLHELSLVTQPSPAPVPPPGQTQSITPTYYLPAPMTGLVGREREVQSGAALLQRANVRLVTLVGPPGAGKTRLSLALAEALKADFVHGACFVPLAPVSDPALVLPAIAHALQVRESAGIPLTQTLHDFLRHKELLLILDNFEQVLEAAPAVGELLSAAPAVKALVSSREPIRLYGEYEFPVPPLAVPDLKYLPTADLLEMYPAVELFVQRAQAVRSTFTVDAQNATLIAQICGWLDGLPLAIEMAAAQIKWQTPAALLAQLRQKLMALTGGPRDLTPRQQTLRGAIDWSYNLLGKQERRLFLSLAVVNDGCIAADAAALSGIDPAECESLLHGLVEKSLLQCEVDGAGEARYMMLQVMREYAQDKLEEQGELTRLQLLHAAIYGRLVEESLPKLRTAAAEQALRRLEIEHNNLRSALEWHLQTDVAGGLQMATWLAESLWGIRGYINEGRSWLERLLAAAPDPRYREEPERLASITRQAAAWIATARMAVGQGDLAAATLFVQRGKSFALESESDSAVRAALRCQASIFFQQSDYAQAGALYQQALDLCHPEIDQREAAGILNGLGLVAKDQGDYSRALAFHQRSYTFFATIGDIIGMARALTYSSIAAYWQGAFEQCIQFAQQCIVIQSGVGDVMSTTYSREVQAIAMVRLGRLDEGITILQECAAAFQQMNDQSGVAVTLVDLGQAAYLQQDPVASLRYHSQALTIAHAIGDRRRIVFSLDGIAMALIQQAASHASTNMGDVATLHQAVCCFAAAETLRQTINAPLPQIERADYEVCRTLAATLLPPDLYTSAWERGWALPLDQLPNLVV
jgi:predicted ATPase/transcriptional regulator with XRE-family HTH domain